MKRIEKNFTTCSKYDLWPNPYTSGGSSLDIALSWHVEIESLNSQSFNLFTANPPISTIPFSPRIEREPSIFLGRVAVVASTTPKAPLENFIKKSYEDNISKLVIITGKGIHSDNEKDPYVSKDLGILKYSIPEFIRNNQELMKMIYEIKEANIEDGGSGAFYIFLKKN